MLWWALPQQIMPGKFCVNTRWLSKTEYKWVRQVKDDLHKAFCIMCNKTINLTRMGEIALRSHMAGSKHQANIKLDGGTTGEATTVYFKGKGSEGQMSTSLAT